MMTPTAETRKGSPVLLVVLVVASLVLTSVYFREGEAGPLHSARRGFLFVMTPFAIAGNAAATPFNRVGSWFSGLTVSRAELDTLRKQNDEMRKALAQQEEMRQENLRLLGLLKLPDKFRIGSVGARIIDRPTDSWEGTVLIDRGTADGVKVGTPVVAAQGLLGQVVVTSAHSSKVRLITDQSSGVAVLVQSTRASGIVHGSVEGNLSLDFVQTDAKHPLKVGDVLLTSGMGGAYPPGLVVGDVSKVATDPAGLFPTVTVGSRVPIGAIEEVLVLVGAQPSPLVGGLE
jgi:rod shape-determining protein MreC